MAESNNLSWLGPAGGYDQSSCRPWEGLEVSVSACEVLHPIWPLALCHPPSAIWHLMLCLCSPAQPSPASMS